jgi:hypothetical protein
MNVVTSARGFRRAAASWATVGNDARAANRLWKEEIGFYAQLREATEGRNAIAALQADPDPWVRVDAATATLEWDPESAAGVLQALIDNETLPRRVRDNATAVLTFWDRGTLTFPISD